MQYQKFIEKSYKGDFSSYPLNFHSYFAGDLFSPEPQSKFPPADPRTLFEPRITNKRERYRTRLVGEISSLRVPGREHLKRYILHKFRNNHKRNTIRGALTSVVKFLTFIQKHGHQNLETMQRSDIEAFVEYEQDRGISAGTISTNLTCLYAFIRFLVDDDVLNRELLKRKIHIKQPKRLP